MSVLHPIWDSIVRFVSGDKEVVEKLQCNYPSHDTRRLCV